MIKIKQNLIVITLLSSFLWSANVLATPVSWSIAGPGTTTATANTPNDWDLSYNLSPAGFSTVIWDVMATATTNGDLTLNWDYTGFHAFFAVTAFLNSTAGDTLVNAGPANCCTAPSAGFSYSGSYTFTNLTAGDVFGFSLGGSNFDSNNVLSGTLNLVEASAVPEPSIIALLSIGLVGIGFSRIQKARSLTEK